LAAFVQNVIFLFLSTGQAGLQLHRVVTGWAEISQVV